MLVVSLANNEPTYSSELQIRTNNEVSQNNNVTNERKMKVKKKHTSIIK